MNKKRSRRRSSSQSKGAEAVFDQEASAMQASEDEEVNAEYVFNDCPSNHESESSEISDDDVEVEVENEEEASAEMNKAMELLPLLLKQQEIGASNVIAVKDVKKVVGDFLKNTEKSGEKLTLKKAASDSTLKKDDKLQKLKEKNETLMEENKKLKNERDGCKVKLKTLIDKQVNESDMHDEERQELSEENAKLSQRVRELEESLKAAAMKRETAHTFRTSTSFMANNEDRFTEGIKKFLEGKDPDTKIYGNYEKWHKDMTKKLSGECVYQCAEQIFVKLYTDKNKDQNRELRFSSKGEYLKFESGCTAKELRDEGWPDDVDHMYILHPEEPKDRKEIPKIIKHADEGKQYFFWTIRIPPEFYREEQNEDQHEHFSVIICAFRCKNC